MNCKRSLSVAAMLVAAVAAPVIGLAQIAPGAGTLGVARPQVAPVTAPASVARPRPTLREGVVAIVNDELISTYDLKQQVAWLTITNGIQLSPQNLAEVQRRALDDLIDERLQNQEIRRYQTLRKLTKNELYAEDKDVEDYLTKMAAQNKLSLDEFLAQLEERGVSRTFLRHQIKIAMSWEDFSRQFYGRKIRVTEVQVKATEELIAASATRPNYLVSEIFIDAERAGGLQQAASQAEQLIAQLTQGARFEAVARQVSALPTAASGGDTGWVAAGELNPSVAAALENMRAGQLSRPIVVADGAYIVLLRDKRAGGGSPVVTLKQAAVALAADAPESAAAEAQKTLLAIKAKNPTCATLATAAGGVTGVEVGDLGEAEVKDLSPAFRTAVENLQTDQVSDPVRTAIGLHLVAVCGRRTQGVAMPSRDQIESKLESDQMAMLVRRELRNLRSAATISQPR